MPPTRRKAPKRSSTQRSTYKAIALKRGAANSAPTLDVFGPFLKEATASQEAMAYSHQKYSDMNPIENDLTINHAHPKRSPAKLADEIETNKATNHHESDYVIINNLAMK